MPTQKTSLVNKFTLPAGHTCKGKGVKSVFGKATIIVARTSCSGADARIRAYTTGDKVRALKSYSGDQAEAFAQAIRLAQGEPTPEPKRTTRKARKARKGRKGPARKAQPSQGRGVAAAEASLEAAVTPPPAPAMPVLEDGEHHYAFYNRVVLAGFSRSKAASEYRRQRDARK